MREDIRREGDSCEEKEGKLGRIDVRVSIVEVNLRMKKREQLLRRFGPSTVAISH